LEKEWRIGGFLWKNQKSYLYVCMHGWNIKVLKFWNISRSQGGILWNLWKLYKRRMKQYKFGGTFGDPTILFYFCIILLVSFNVCVCFFSSFKWKKYVVRNNNFATWHNYHMGVNIFIILKVFFLLLFLSSCNTIILKLINLLT
jgi:hypothetical protein